MRTTTDSITRLEMKKLNTEWHKPLAGMYEPANILVTKGRIIEAIELAYAIHLQNYGSIDNIKFRCVTESTTINYIN